MPTYVAIADRDSLAGGGAAADQARRLPDGTVDVWPDTTHSLPMQAKDKLDAELAKPQAEQCASCISDLKLEIASCEKMIADLDTQITNLSTQIEDRVKLYNLTMEERVRIANRVKATDEAWDNLNIVKESIFTAIERGGMPPPPRRP